MKYTLLLVFTTILYTANAQSQFVSDQNPNYTLSQQRYTKVLDSLETTMNTTIQNTYKAYDWYEAKLEKQENKMKARYKIRLIRAENRNNNYNWGNNINNNWGWGYQHFFPCTIQRRGNWWYRW
jgi:hypothetical protein